MMIMMMMIVIIVISGTDFYRRTTDFSAKFDVAIPNQTHLSLFIFVTDIFCVSS
jgi:hypothetical protein